MEQYPLEDIATASAEHLGALNWVGMEGIALPLQIAGQPISGRASAGVSLDDPAARGIHMSRLYLALADLEQKELALPLITNVLDTFWQAMRGCHNKPFSISKVRRYCAVKR